MSWIIIIYAALIAGYFFLILYYLAGWKKIRQWKKFEKSFSTKVSIIIPARNEERYIGNCIADILRQEYPKDLFEIIVVDDHSEDKTVKAVRHVQTDQVKLLQLSELITTATKAYKKKAIETGIQHASGELIITTDADCRMDKHWLESIVSYYEEKRPKMIAGPVRYFDDRTVFQKFQNIELMGLIGIGAASISYGKPALCNGANLAYEKSAFYEVNGFEGIDNLASGDDLLLMQKMAKKHAGEIKFLKSRQAIVYTHPKRTVKEFIGQRRRWASKTMQYPNKQLIFISAFFFIYSFSMLVLFVLSFFEPELFMLLLLQIAVKMAVDYLFLGRILQFFKLNKYLWLFLSSQFLHIIFMISSAFFLLKKEYRWKGRTVN